MGNLAYKLKKISKMNPRVVIKKLLSFDEVFAIGYRKRGKDLLPVLGSGEFRALPLSRSFWYADPIILKRDGRNYLFMEAFDQKDQRGKIACCRLTDNGPTPVKVIIDEPFHMSFPTVFEFDSDVYMIPETSADKSLRLYRACSFPDKWELACRFDLGRLFVDTVILQKTDSSFELLTCEVSPYKEYECRFQKFSVNKDPGDSFTITEDISFNSCQEYDLLSRNGGALFELGGKRYVAAQESTSSEYGLYMNFFEYNDDSKKIATVPRYRISKNSFILKGAPRGEGVHSYCFSDDYEIVDLKYMEFAPKKILQRLKERHK